MSTKVCPSCDMDVPAAASRCKHCFHDFNEEPVEKGGGLIRMLVFLAAILTLGTGAMAYMYYRSAEISTLDPETKSVIVTRKSAAKTETERIPFEQITKIEHVMGGEDYLYEVVAVTQAGKRYTLRGSGDKPMKGHAEHIAAVLDKPMVEVRNIKTFGD